jgi:hypothetical protein
MSVSKQFLELGGASWTGEGLSTCSYAVKFLYRSIFLDDDILLLNPCFRKNMPTNPPGSPGSGEGRAKKFCRYHHEEIL